MLSHRYRYIPEVVGSMSEFKEEITVKSDVAPSSVASAAAPSYGALSENLEGTAGNPTYYLSTAIAYTNGHPHMGHAYEVTG